MGDCVRFLSLARPAARVALAAVTVAAFAIAVLPLGVSAEPGMAPPVCLSEPTLRTVERSPGSVIFTGRVAAVVPATGVVQLEVDRWYHLGTGGGVVPGIHPGQMIVRPVPPAASAVGPGPGHDLALGSRWFVAGTWAAGSSPVEVGCGAFAGTLSVVGAAWLAAADAAYGAVEPPKPGDLAPAGAPPWLPIAGGIIVALVLAALLAAVADGRDPLPAS